MNQAAFDAGAVVLDSAETRAVPESDGVVARRYRHGGLADRVVVRLVAEGHRAAADTEAALSGFAPDGEVAVGRRRRRSLGFPQWTLVHDRARAALALSVVPAFRKLARAAGSKPGNARDGYVELARTLERKAPSVLPTFHEQVARVFVDAGNLKFAATFFDKARAAEQAYGLSVDPARQAEVFLEFALVGAVTVKAIGDWLKDVARSGGAAVAYEQLMRLAIGRTHGGLAPWAAFPKDLARLATAAGVDPLEAQVRYLREVAAAPAIDRFPASLWKELGPALRRVLLPGSPLAARLPTGTASRWDDVDEAFVDWWLGVLHAAGALEPTRLPADWLSRFLSWAPDRYGPALTLVRWWAEARPGTPVTVDRPWFDADTLDLLVELGLPTTLADGCDLTLRGWASGQPVPASFGRPSEPRPRPLAALGAGDHKLTLWHQVRHLLSDPVFSAAAKANPVLFEARHDALTGWCSAVELGPLPVAADCLAELEQLAFSDVVASVPSAATFDLGEALAGSLQGGVLEERWWPAFDAAVAELGGEDVLVGGGWPWVVVASGRRAIALGPADERVALDLTAPKGHRLMCVRWLDGALLAGWLTGDGEEVASWSTAPKDWFEVSFNQYGEQVYPALPLAGGGVFVGGGVFRRGDRQWPEEEGFHCDGEKGWSAAGKGLVDAAGGPPPAAPPSFLAEVPEERRDQATLTWLPAGPVGLRTLDGRTWETLDGHTWTGDDRPEWVGAWPGDGRPRAICAGWRSLTLHDGAVVDALGRRSWLPAAAWWRTVPRSPGASAALRAIDAATARALLAVASDDEEATALAVGRVVPALDVPGLREGVARQVTLARSLQERLRAWREGTTTNSDDDAPEGVPTLERWHGVLGLAVTESAYDGADLLRGLRERAAFLAGGLGGRPDRRAGRRDPPPPPARRGLRARAARAVGRRPRARARGARGLARPAAAARARRHLVVPRPVVAVPADRARGRRAAPPRGLGRRAGRHPLRRAHRRHLVRRGPVRRHHLVGGARRSARRHAHRAALRGAHAPRGRRVAARPARRRPPPRLGPGRPRAPRRGHRAVSGRGGAAAGRRSGDRPVGPQLPRRGPRAPRPQGQGGRARPRRPPPAAAPPRSARSWPAPRPTTRPTSADPRSSG